MNWLEKDIYEGIKNGDKNIFDLVFKSHYSGLCIFANDYLKSYDIAEEVVQEVFVTLWEKRSKIIIKTSLKAYLYRCVRNGCLNYIRDNSTKDFKKVQIEEIKSRSDLMFIEIPDTVFDWAFTETMEHELDETIESLPEQCRIIFNMSRYENLPYPKIAETLNISLSTVKTQMSRAVNKLREKMSKYFENSDNH